MWKEHFCLGCYCWTNEKDDILRITLYNQWRVELNTKRLGEFKTKREAFDFANNYMEKN